MEQEEEEVQISGTHTLSNPARAFVSLTREIVQSEGKLDLTQMMETSNFIQACHLGSLVKVQEIQEVPTQECVGKANNFVPHLIHLVGKNHWIPLSPSSVYNRIQAQALFFIVQTSPDTQSSYVSRFPGISHVHRFFSYFIKN